MSNPITRPVLRYHGGKFGIRGTLADRIIAEFPPHRVYVEAFGGGGSVLMRKPRSYAEVYNDRWDAVVNVFRVLRDPATAAELERRLRLTPFARAEFEQTAAAHIAEVTDPVDLARLTIMRSFMGFASGASNPFYATGFRSNSNRSGTTPAYDWQHYPDHIAGFVDRLQGVVIENRDALAIIPQHDSADTLFYVDPPYVHATRSDKARPQREYVFELTDEDHRALAATLRNVKGMVVLSGYDSELYTCLYDGWRQLSFGALAAGARARTEVLWFNAAAWERKGHAAGRLFA